MSNVIKLRKNQNLDSSLLLEPNSNQTDKGAHGPQFYCYFWSPKVTKNLRLI